MHRHTHQQLNGRQYPQRMAVNVAIDMTLAGREQAVFLVTRREGRWGIEGRSIIEAGDGHS